MRPSDTNIIRIDGSLGEGGGQILRTSLALSCVLRVPVEVVNIRKARQKPGLQPQHLTAVNAAAAVCRAKVEGAHLSSIAVRFEPDAVAGGDYLFDVSEKKGSAGSAPLVLQTVLPPLCFANRPSTVTVIGGTHVPWSPTAHYLEQVFSPMLARIGVNAEILLEKWGWYPAGGGKLRHGPGPDRGGGGPVEPGVPLGVDGEPGRGGGASGGCPRPEQGRSVRQPDAAVQGASASLDA